LKRNNLLTVELNDYLSNDKHGHVSNYTYKSTNNIIRLLVIGWLNAVIHAWPYDLKYKVYDNGISVFVC